MLRSSHCGLAVTYENRVSFWQIQTSVGFRTVRYTFTLYLIYTCQQYPNFWAGDVRISEFFSPRCGNLCILQPGCENLWILQLEIRGSAESTAGECTESAHSPAGVARISGFCRSSGQRGEILQILRLEMPESSHSPAGVARISGFCRSSGWRCENLQILQLEMPESAHSPARVARISGFCRFSGRRYENLWILQPEMQKFWGWRCRAEIFFHLKFIFFWYHLFSLSFSSSSLKFNFFQYIY
jgi:hypothetical protein